jgi:cytidylate kinase
MPQVSIYIDRYTLERIETVSRKEKLSLSKVVTKSIERYLNESWPEGYSELFGSIRDDSFKRHQVVLESNGVTRLSLTK